MGQYKLYTLCQKIMLMQKDFSTKKYRPETRPVYTSLILILNMDSAIDTISWFLKTDYLESQAIKTWNGKTTISEVIKSYRTIFKKYLIKVSCRKKVAIFYLHRDVYFAAVKALMQSHVQSGAHYPWCLAVCCHPP